MTARPLTIHYPYSTRQMLTFSYFWPDWIFYARLGVFHTIFSTKRSHSYFSPQNLRLKFFIIGFLASVAYCNISALFNWCQWSSCLGSRMLNTEVVPGTKQNLQFTRSSRYKCGRGERNSRKIWNSEVDRSCESSGLRQGNEAKYHTCDKETKQCLEHYIQHISTEAHFIDASHETQPDDLTLISSFSWNLAQWSQNRPQKKNRLDGRKQNIACTEVPVGKGTAP